MAGGLRWGFELQDKLSAPAAKMSSNLERLGTQMQKLERSSQHAENAIVKMADRFVTRLISGELAVEGIRKLSETVMELGKSFLDTAIAAAGFKSQSLFTLGALTKSKLEAAEIFDWVNAIAGKAGYAADYIMQMSQGFIKSGATVPEMQRLVLLATDVSSVLGKDIGSEWASSFARMMQAPNIMFRELKPMLSNMGLFEDVINRIAKASGVSAHDIRKQFSDMAPAVAGPMKEVALTAIWQATQQKISGGMIATATEETSRKLSRSLERIKTNWERLFEDVDLSQFAGFFSILADKLNPAVESGRLLKETFENVFKAGSEFARTFLTSIGPVVPSLESVRDYTRGLVPAFEFLGGVVGFVFGKLRIELDQFLSGVRGIGRALSWASAPLGPLNEVISGLVMPLPGPRTLQGTAPPAMLTRERGPPALLARESMNPWDMGFDWGSRLGGAVLAGHDDRTATRSPSEEWEKRGRYAAEGYQRGVDFGGDGSSSTALARRGGANIVIHNSPTINVTTGPDVNAEEVAQRLAELSLNQLQAALDTAAQQVGGL